jgi:AraC-like DNA-binding protein
MHTTPHFLSDRPEVQDSDVDVMSEVLDAVHLTTAIFGRLEVGAPWRLRVPERSFLSFYVVSRGSAWLELCDSGNTEAIPLSLGDAIILPRGSAHELRDVERSDAIPIDFDYAACPRSCNGQPIVLGGSGPVTSIVTGHFTFAASPRNALLGSLPAAIHLPADAVASPPLGAVVPLLLAESATPGPGSTIALARLADLLLIHALRYWRATKGADSCGLRAIADPAIGSALQLMHARPAEPWTVATLASAVAMSRSAFAARFAELVGESPLQYLTRWRMSIAARLLEEEDLGIATVADRVGYANPVAFTKAFTRMQGIGPGAYRRGKRAAAPEGERKDRLRVV